MHPRPDIGKQVLRVLASQSTTGEADLLALDAQKVISFDRILELGNQ